MRKGLTIIAAAAAAVMAGPALSAQAASALRLTPAGDSTQFDHFVPLAGSADTLVLTRQPSLPRDVNLSGNADPRYSSAPDQMYLRTASGQLRRLGLQPLEAERFSLVGTTLAAGRSIDDDTSRTNEAYVWKTTTGKRTDIALPDSTEYLAVAPDGVLYATPTGGLAIRTVSGQTTSLGTPFGSTVRIISAAVDAAGAVVTDDHGGIAFVSFAASHTVTAMQNPVPGTPMTCYQLAGSYAACAMAAYDSDVAAYVPNSPVLEPIDGSAPTVEATTDGCAEFARLAVAGNTELWTCAVFDGTEVTYALHSLAAGSSVSTVSTAALGYPLVSAYGKAIGATTDQGSLYQATSAVTGSTLIAATPSAVAVDLFQLTSDGVVYSDNQRVASRPDELESVFTRTLHATGSSLKVGTPRLVGGAAVGVGGNLVGLSKAITVYATKASPGHSLGNAVLHVIGKHRTATLHDAVGQGQIQVSGSRVLYQTWNDGSPRVTVYDAATGKIIASRKAHGLDYHGYALSGHYLAWASPHGAIYRENLRSGDTKLLRKALPHDPGGVEFSVYAHGNWVGWHALPVQHELAKALNQIRNAKTMAPVVSLPHTLYSLSSAGAILSSTHATFRAGFAQAGEVPHATRFWLRGYSGTTHALLPKASYVTGPQIAGRVLAWGDADGVLRVRLLAR